MVTVLGVLGLGAASAFACANEQLRGEDHSRSLPDCRSYELVTPPFKDGDPVTETSEGDAIADPAGEAEAITFQDIGGFAGAENDSSVNGSAYVARRGPDGWASTPAGYSSEKFQNGETPGEFEIVDFNSTLDTSLFFAAPLTAPTPLYLGAYARPVGGGEPVEVGPLIEPAKAATFAAGDEQKLPLIRYTGASSNFEHVFFSLINRVAETNWFWQKDGTVVNESLYEYSGRGNPEPELVGVTGGRGSDQLISQCGVVLGSPGLGPGESNRSAGSFAEGYNAIATRGVAAGGARVFFTAIGVNAEHEGKHGCIENGAKTEVVGTGPLVNELYARVPAAADPAGLETVAISEPSEAQCGACRTGHSKVTVTERPAVFQGANEAGTKMFFLSSQELLAGAAGDNLYEYNFHPEEEGKKADEAVSLVAPEMAPAEGAQGGVVRVSENGEMVYLVSEDSALAANTDANGNTAAQEAAAGHDQLLYALTRSRGARRCSSRRSPQQTAQTGSSGTAGRCRRRRMGAFCCSRA